MEQKTKFCLLNSLFHVQDWKIPRSVTYFKNNGPLFTGFQALLRLLLQLSGLALPQTKLRLFLVKTGRQNSQPQQKMGLKSRKSRKFPHSKDSNSAISQKSMLKSTSSDQFPVEKPPKWLKQTGTIFSKDLLLPVQFSKIKMVPSIPLEKCLQI